MKFLSNSLLTGSLLLALGTGIASSAQAGLFDEPDAVEVCDYRTHGVLFDQQIKLYSGCPAAREGIMPSFEVIRQLPVEQHGDLYASGEVTTHFDHDLNCLDPVTSRWSKDFGG